MKFNTKLILTFIIIMLMPLAFSFIAFWVFGGNSEMTFEVEQIFVSFLVLFALTAVLLILWLERAIFNPADELRRAMERIAEGNFEEPIQIKIKDNGEVGKIFRDFEKMRLTLKSMSDRQAEADRVSKELVSNISHDLKTPITSIKGYVEGIMDGVADSPEKMEKYVHTIYNKANDMDRLIDELTMYSRIGTDQIPYKFINLNVNEYFSDCADEIGLDLEGHGIRFSYRNMVLDDVRIFADPEQIKRVINNIVNNSVKYGKEEGAEIELTLLDIGEEIEVCIADNGKGIDKEDLPRLFERFYRTDRSRNSSKGGSGIGLSIAQKIINDHEGRIWARSEKNCGLAISFTLMKIMPPIEIEESKDEPNTIARIEKAIANTAINVKNETEKRIHEMERLHKRENKEVRETEERENENG